MAGKRLTKKQVAHKLRRLRGNMAAVGRSFGVTRQAVAEFVSRHAELKAILIETREARIDLAESGLDRALVNYESWAISLTLRTLGRKRGYGEKLEIGPIEEMTDDELLAIAAGRGQGIIAPARDSG